MPVGGAVIVFPPARNAEAVFGIQCLCGGVACADFEQQALRAFGQMCVPIFEQGGRNAPSAAFGRGGNQVQFGFVGQVLPNDKGGNPAVFFRKENLFGRRNKRGLKLALRPRGRVADGIERASVRRSRTARLGGCSCSCLPFRLFFGSQGDFVADVEQFGVCRASCGIAAAEGEREKIGGGRHIGFA